MKQKTAKCKNCGKKNSAENSLFLNLKAYCNYECATEFGKKNIEKGERIKKQEYNKETARLKKDFSLKGNIYNQDFSLNKANINKSYGIGFTSSIEF